ncbi:anoctamin-10-like, partial [Amphiura filiformis]|uniref:anoctamin-10-like n=1 Tax=Amphiura filiformis TaxID=82378 RepID=UPI003B21C010
RDHSPHHHGHDGCAHDVKSSILTKPDSSRFQPLCILEFSKKTSPATREWLLSRIQASRDDGGAGLEAETALDENGEETVLRIGASKKRLLEGAEMACLKKHCKDGNLREFSRVNLDQFPHEDKHFLTTCDCQRIIYYLLLQIRSNEKQDIPGCSKLVLYKGQRVIPKCIDAKLIAQLYPLHIPEELAGLTKIWYATFNTLSLDQPIERIREYFGEAMGIYFSFLGFYTKALFLPAGVGLFYYLYYTFFGKSSHGYAVFAIFNLIWTTLFLESWKRKCATMAYHWGTYGMVKFEEARAEFVGVLTINAVTGRKEPYYPKWKRQLKKYAVSAPIIFVILVMAFFVMLASFKCEDYIMERYDVKTTTGSIMFSLPSCVYAVVILVTNGFYRNLAKWLNDWENHRLQSAYENNLIIKLVVFDFANCFMCLFYVAFWLQDMVRLRQYLATLLIVQQLLQQFLETGLPYIMLLIRGGSKGEEEKKKDDDADGVEVAELANEQSKMDLYPGTFDDYLELFLQFGYVFLFSAVYPLAAIWALFNNVIEIRSDAFKVSRVCQRPFGQSAADIGTWQVTFEVMGIIAVLTNTTLMAMSPEIRQFLPEMTVTNYILLFVAVEHVFLALKAAIAILIPDLPRWMEIELLKEEYESRQVYLQKISESHKLDVSTTQQHPLSRQDSGIQVEEIELAEQRENEDIEEEEENQSDSGEDMTKPNGGHEQKEEDLTWADMQESQI